MDIDFYVMDIDIPGYLYKVDDLYHRYKSAVSTTEHATGVTDMVAPSRVSPHASMAEWPQSSSVSKCIDHDLG
ncbi:hypothetical protein J6590_016465 [Homalodisca vitripennis]|nr:hypothetical protein J6590_016465 [Homalodisca vitripennis]